MNYWQKRMADRQEFLNKKTQRDIDKQLAKYYEQVMRNLIKEFEAVYDKLMTTKEANLTPADLYKLDRYWSMQAQVREVLQALGEEEIALLSVAFENHWRTSYQNAEQDMLNFFNRRAKKSPDLKELVWPPDSTFSTISQTSVQQMVNEVWCADGKSWSDRVWNNVSSLATMLNDELIHCVTSGKKTTELKNKLIERFNVSYNKADRIVRTEVAHIQTQASAKRYKDAGLKKYEVLGREEEDGCNHKPDCHDMDGKTFLYSEMKVGVNAPPFHPNCRCAIAPFFDDDDELEEEIMKDKQSMMVEKVKEYYPEVLERETDRLTREWYKRLKKIDQNIELAEADVSSPGSREDAEMRARDLLKLEKLKQERLAVVGKIEHNKKLAEWVINDFVFCMDCGKPIPIDGNKTNAIKRCPECSKKHRKDMKALYEKQRRKKKKLSSRG